MPRLIEWNPFKEIERLRGEFDRVLDRFRSSEELGELDEKLVRPRIESYIEDGKLTVRADMPGIDAKDIEVKVSGNTLEVRGKREDKKETRKRDFLRREVHYGSYVYSTTMPDGIKAEDVKANYRDGVLELTAALPKEIAPKEVKVNVETTAPAEVEAKEKAAA
ncbi:MAG TPA: Hsp20/alpha crystallin family protein [Candidatus Binataceae bacterium]|nr:Hsp20/alpha crystallin family protein [Candidatus Binataceae bacterium]